MPPKKKIRVDSNQTKLTFQSSKRSAGAVENATQIEDAAALDRQAGDGDSTSQSSTSRSSGAAPRSTGEGDCAKQRKYRTKWEQDYCLSMCFCN